uniref:Uncharacterized protein LOC105135945 n=1 Tax=Rhizophora mucronata TaxID=61149 RepID=A0A2P2JD57_RHIMU
MEISLNSLNNFINYSRSPVELIWNPLKTKLHFLQLRFTNWQKRSTIYEYPLL